MSKKESFTPAWTEEAPRQGTYRSIFKWGDPAGFKHPNRRFYRLMKDVFQMDDADFGQPQEEGNETVVCKQAIRLSDERGPITRKRDGETCNIWRNRCRSSTGLSANRSSSSHMTMTCAKRGLATIMVSASRTSKGTNSSAVSRPS